MGYLTRLDPGVGAVGDLMDDFFKGFFVRPLYQPAAQEGERTEVLRARMDVIESNGNYVVTAELPGVKKEDIQIGIDGAEVTLSAEIKREREVKTDERVLHAGRSYGRIARSFTLPQDIDEAKAQAKFKDGVLELTLPKKAAAARKTITVQ